METDFLDDDFGGGPADDDVAGLQNYYTNSLNYYMISQITTQIYLHKFKLLHKFLKLLHKFLYIIVFTQISSQGTRIFWMTTSEEAPRMMTWLAASPGLTKPARFLRPEPTV